MTPSASAIATTCTDHGFMVRSTEDGFIAESDDGVRIEARKQPGFWLDLPGYATRRVSAVVIRDVLAGARRW